MGVGSEERKMVRKRKRHIGVDLVITTICLMAITTLLGKEINLTKLDITYLYMIVFLCVQSISQKGGD